MAFPVPKWRSGTGVVILVNCSNRQIVSLRDPTRSHWHVAKSVYFPDRPVRLPDDPHDYGVLNFNAPVDNSIFLKTVYSSTQAWTGPCKYNGLELTTADPNNPADRQTISFDLNICRNHMLALLAPLVVTRSAKPAEADAQD